MTMSMLCGIGFVAMEMALGATCFGALNQSSLWAYENAQSQKAGVYGETYIENVAPLLRVKECVPSFR